MKALGLPRRGHCLLAAEIRADDGSLKGVRLLGGSVAFGERAADALIRDGTRGPELVPKGLKAWLSGAWDAEPRGGR